MWKYEGISFVGHHSNFGISIQRTSVYTIRHVKHFITAFFDANKRNKYIGIYIILIGTVGIGTNIDYLCIIIYDLYGRNVYKHYIYVGR